ncbi:hypothetical protein DL767_011435 [Monosporascus sp. MG133]|nr:hypothetical protein DL767_011435 [Monosporascus sp. MG133]
MESYNFCTQLELEASERIRRETGGRQREAVRTYWGLPPPPPPPPPDRFRTRGAASPDLMEGSGASRPLDATGMFNPMADVREEDSEDELGSRTIACRSGSATSRTGGASDSDGMSARGARFSTLRTAPRETESPRKRRRSSSEVSKRELEAEEELEETLIGRNSDLEDEETLTGSDDDLEVQETDNDESGFEIPLSAVDLPKAGEAAI